MAGKTALVIDDSRSARFVLRKFLESHGYAVDTAESAQDAYFYLRRKRPDAVFLDHLMPGADGFQSLRVLRQDARLSGMPIVLCSSDESEAFAADACAQGAFDVLAKPPSPDDLTDVLQRIEQLSVHGRSLPRAVRRPLQRAEMAPVEAGAGEADGRDSTAAQLAGLSHMLCLQIAELRAQAAQLRSGQASADESGLQGASQDLMYARIEALGHQMEDALTAQNRLLMAAIDTQSQRIEAMRTLLLRTLDQDRSYRLSESR